MKARDPRSSLQLVTGLAARLVDRARDTVAQVAGQVGKSGDDPAPRKRPKVRRAKPARAAKPAARREKAPAARAKTKKRRRAASGKAVTKTRRRRSAAPPVGARHKR